jgi:hypothetical protein
MIKGVADYAGEKATDDDIVKLQSELKSAGAKDAENLLTDPDPTANKSLKALIQKIATIRAMRVALALLEEGIR